MVSLEEKSQYRLKIRENPKLKAFWELLYHSEIRSPSTHEVEIDEIYFGILRAISQGSKKQFEEFFGRISKRHVDKDSASPFIYDDGLIFSIVVGVKLFQVDGAWIKNVVSIRSSSETTITLSQLLNDNFISKSNVPQIVIPFLDLTQQLGKHEQLLDSSFGQISSDAELFSKNNDFFIIMSLRSYDLIIESKISQAGDLERLKLFEKRFLNRVRITSLLLYNLTLFTLIYYSIKGLAMAPVLKDKLNDLALIISIIGTSLSNLFSILKRKLEYFVGFALGHRSRQ